MLPVDAANGGKEDRSDRSANKKVSRNDINDVVRDCMLLEIKCTRMPRTTACMHSVDVQWPWPSETSAEASAIFVNG